MTGEYQALSNDDNNNYGIALNNINGNLNSRESAIQNTVLNIDNELVGYEVPRPRRKARLYWADCTRIYSMFAIVFLHCAGYTFEKTLRNRNDKDWKIVCIYNSLTRFSVPVFVLLSGTFFLDPAKPFSFKKLFKRNILRLVTAFYFWSFINSLINNLTPKDRPSIFSWAFQKGLIGKFLVGEEYLWFILMIIGCYIIIPFLRFFSDDIVLARYFIGLWIFWSSLMPTLKSLIALGPMNHFNDGLNVWLSRWHFHFSLEFVGYFVTGYHLVKHVNLNFFARCVLYILCVIDVIIYISLTLYHEKRDNLYSESFRGNFSLFVLFYSIVVFIFFRYEVGRIKFTDKQARIITKVSSLTFGIYLSHLIVRNMLDRYLHITQRSFFGINYSAFIGCPIQFIIVSAISLSISYGLSRVPVLKNYVV